MAAIPTPNNLLIDTHTLVLRLEESETPGRIRFRGEFGRVDKPTANKRFYSETLMRREFGRLAENMKRRRVLGELDHPADGRTRLQRVSHVITDLAVDGAQVIGEAEPLDTPNGRILMALAKAGVEVGVSSRGYGSTKPRGDGVEEVQEDFKLETYDFVYDPADPTARPAFYTEEKAKIPEDGMDLTVESLKKDYPGLLEELKAEFLDEFRSTVLSEAQGERALAVSEAVQKAAVETEERVTRRLSEKFSGQLRRSLEQVEVAAIERARSEAASDPGVAQARGIVEQIAKIVSPFGVPADVQEALAEKDAQIEELQAQIAERELEVQAAEAKAEEMSRLAKKAAYQLELEKGLRGESDERRRAVINLVGDVAQFESVDALHERMAAIAGELNTAKPDVPEADPVAEDERTSFEERLTALEEQVQQGQAELAEAKGKVEEANARTKRALDAAEEATAKAFAEGVAMFHPQGESIKAMAEDVTTIAQAERMVEELDKVTSPQGSQGVLDEATRDKIRARVAQGKQRSLEEDTHGAGGANGKGNGKSNGGPAIIGMDPTEFDRLAGTTRQ